MKIVQFVKCHSIFVVQIVLFPVIVALQVEMCFLSVTHSDRSLQAQLSRTLHEQMAPIT